MKIKVYPQGKLPKKDWLQEVQFMCADSQYNDYLPEDSGVLAVIPAESLKSFGRRLKKAVKILMIDEEADRVIGCAFIAKDRKNKKDGLVYRLHDVYVRARYRNLGVATRLVDYATLEAHKLKVDKLELSVNPLNDQALHIYKQALFKIMPGQSIMMQRKHV